LGLRTGCGCQSQNSYQGAVNYAGAAAAWDAYRRGRYQRNVANLDSPDHLANSLGRVKEQDSTNRMLTSLGRSVTAYEQEARQLSRPPLGLTRSAQSASRTSAAVNNLGRGFKYGGRALLVVGAGISIYDILTASPCQRGSGYLARDRGLGWLPCGRLRRSGTLRWHRAGRWWARRRRYRRYHRRSCGRHLWLQ
jgi:hypothetical protein